MVRLQSLWSCCLCCMTGIVSAAPARVAIEPVEGIVAITTPSADVKLAFVQPGIVADVPVKEGDRVAAGQLLVRQDDSVEQVQLAQLKIKSEDTTQIRAAEASLEQKRVDLKKLEWAADRGSATSLEVEHARLDVLLAELSLKLAQVEHQIEGLRYKEAQARVDLRFLKSPIAGRVEKVDCEKGECVDARADTLRVVQTDPLWIEVPVPLAQSRGLETGGSARVLFSGADDKPIEGTIIFVASVVDAASDTLRVKVEAPNKAGRPAGEHVRVVFPKAAR